MRKAALVFTVLLAAIGCEEKPVYQGSPAVHLSLQEVGRTSVSVAVESLNTEAVFLLCKAGDAAPGADGVVSGGVRCEESSYSFSDLTPDTGYSVYAVGRAPGGKLSKVESVSFTTGLLAQDLYPWEKERKGVPAPADLTLCTGGGRPNSNSWFSIPMYWDAARFAPHVSYVDGDGEHWLFEGFLAITGIDMDGRNFGINPNGGLSAPKESWEALASYWLDKGGAFDELDKAIEAAAARIGDPPRKRYVVMTVPDPIMFERFSDKQSSTTYWGVLDGKLLDFSKVEDQIKACEWYADLVREKFNALKARHLELAGFYILSEELVAKSSGYNYIYKRWDRILPKFAEYLHQRNEGLYWIPYLNADGTDLWKELGIDCAWLQPNYYWDYNNDKPIAQAFRSISALGMGLELEFEYSMVEGVMKTPGIMGPDGAGRYVFSLKDVPSLRSRFRQYMSGFKDAGLYGQRPIALYSGSNALYQLATSEETEDIAIYLELCRFVSDSPLRSSH